MSYIAPDPSIAAAQNIFNYAVTTVAVAAVVVSLVGNFVILSKFRNDPNKNKDAITEDDVHQTGKIENLSVKYYNNALQRANLTLWSSLTLGLAGFGIIVFPLVTSVSGDWKNTSVKVFGGGIIELVCTICFQQANSAQKVMAECLDKLRLDRKRAENVALILQIEDSKLRDKCRYNIVMEQSEMSSDHRSTGSLDA